MKVSIITATYNSAKTLRDTIDSVLNRVGSLFIIDLIIVN